ncbi:hypothetical protein [Arthrobacter bambusae]|jgi:hypothetical protein|uniref:hypothetical protein n=1 Tax=Arthrobacter bambusae TaxID=1338426 RepID=UPI0027859CEA|nr:hypothetical protein [Arthrobacter bambusae]MDQ0241862.1 hypothetical protein [Arthrobacter bambusae]
MNLSAITYPKDTKNRVRNLLVQELPPAGRGARTSPAARSESPSGLPPAPTAAIGVAAGRPSPAALTVGQDARDILDGLPAINAPAH